MRLGVLSCALLVLLSDRTSAQAPPESTPEPQAAPAQRVPVELFTAPQAKKIDMESFPHSELDREGWVELAFMVDKGGKPFEVTVIRSTGNPTFEKVAVRSIEHSTFEPAMLNGAPIESGTEMKYLFKNARFEQSPGAQPGFVKYYKALGKAVTSGDRTAADEAMQKLQVTNLYEDAYFGVASYLYATKFGNEEQQLEGLRRAIAREDTAHYLPRDLFRFALFNCMQLEVKHLQYAEAETTWKRMQKVNLDKDTYERLQRQVAKLETIRNDDTTYSVPGQISDKNWYLHLFKRRFMAEVHSGYISEVRLRCDKRYWFFHFDPALHYEINRNDGQCSIELVGAPGTQFKLMQF